MTNNVSVIPSVVFTAVADVDIISEIG